MKHAIRNLLRALGAIIKTDHQGKSQTGREDKVRGLSALPLSFDLNREIQQLRYEEQGVLRLGIGVLGAGAAIAAGLMDWMDVDPPEKAVGMVHAIVNTNATLVFLASFLMRRSDHWELSWEAFAVALVGCALVMGGGYLGGGMVYHMGVMINRNAYRNGPDDFQPALAVAELAEGQLKRVEVEGLPVLLVKSGGKIYALGAVCSHYGAPLNEGRLDGNTIQCPWHFSRFALEDGSVREGPTRAVQAPSEKKL